jgi:hypothetical protein
MMAMPKDATLGRGQPEDCVRQLFGATTKLALPQIETATQQVATIAFGNYASWFQL